MKSKVRGGVFSVLKKALKARAMTYADLAIELDLSEPSVKRIFSEGDCKLSRLLEICEILDVSAEDVMQRAERNGDESKFLSLAIEAKFAANPSVFALFILLRDAISEEHIKQVYNLREEDMFAHGRELERLGLAEVHPTGRRIRLKLNQPVKFRHSGPLHKLMKKINVQFFSQVMDKGTTEESTMTGVSRRVLPDTVKIIQKEIIELNKLLINLARQDQLIANNEELKTFKLAIALDAISFPDLLMIERVKLPDKKGANI